VLVVFADANDLVREGVAGLLTLSVFERARALGLVRAVGMTRAQGCGRWSAGTLRRSPSVLSYVVLAAASGVLAAVGSAAAARSTS
jgi:hypothetical protein